jgi:hypothetical protein
MRTIGIVAERSGDKEQQVRCAQELSIYCEDVFVSGDDTTWIECIVEDHYIPDWVMVAYDDEIPSQRMRYMFDSLIFNEHVNTWTSKIKCMWDDETYRIDKLWATFEEPTLWRWIPEMDYRWKDHLKDLIPINQPGPIQDSSVPFLSYRYANDAFRVKEYVNFLEHESEYNEISRMHYKSLMDENGSLMLERLIDE